MIEHFYKNSIIYIISTLLTRGMSLILLPILTKYLTPANYGLIDLITTTGTFVLIIFGLESYQGIARHIVECKTIDDKKSLFSNTIFFLAISYAILLIVANISISVININHIINSRHLLNIIIFTYFAQALIVNIQALLRYDLLVKNSFVTSIINAIGIMVCNIIFVAWLKLGINGAIYASLIGNIVGVICGTYYIKNYLGGTFNFKKIKAIIKFTYPLAISAIFTIIMLYIDRIMLSRLMSLKEVGLFGVGIKIAAIVTLITSSTQAALGPLIYNNFKDQTTPVKLSNLFSKFIQFACIFILGINIFAGELLYVFTDKSYFGAIDVIKIVTPSLVLSQLYIFFPGMNITKNTKLILYLNIIGAVINTTLNYILIKIYGLNGATIATFISYLIFITIFAKCSQKRYYIPIDFKNIAKYIIMLIIAISINQIWLINQSWQQIGIKLLILIIFTIIIFNKKINYNKKFY